MKLEHVEDAVVEGANEGERVWTFLRVRRKEEKRGVILGTEKFEGGGVFEGVDGVLLGEFLGVWFF